MAQLPTDPVAKLAIAVGLLRTDLLGKEDLQRIFSAADTPILISALGNENLHLRSWASTTLEDRREREVTTLLLSTWLSPSNPVVRQEILKLLVGREGVDIDDIISTGLGDPNPYVRQKAAGYLGESGVSITTVIAALANTNETVREEANKVLRDRPKKDREMIEGIIKEYLGI